MVKKFEIMRIFTKIAIIFLLISSLTSNKLLAQSPVTIEADKLYLVTKFDGAEFLGNIVSYDARELLIRTQKIGDVYIPKHEIKEIKEVNPEIYKEFSGEELFATRYFITTNGLPIKKGENYIQWNLYGPDFQFGVADNFGVGIMTSWAAIPIIINAKYSINLGKNTNMALGLLAGTGSWAAPDFGGVLPFAALTFGNRKNNITFSAGYGALFLSNDVYNPMTYISTKDHFTEGRVLLSIAGMAKISPKFSIVFDTFISPIGTERTVTNWVDKGVYDPTKPNYIPNYVQEKSIERSPGLAIILPGIRWQLKPDAAFQFGFTGFYFDNKFQPFPIPMVQWYRRL
jgi:hypothetical protein